MKKQLSRSFCIGRTTPFLGIRSAFCLITLVMTLIITQACTKKPETGPGVARWDRETCERCRMAVSDHFYSAQVRGAETGMRTKLYFFDDLGCAVIWLDNQDWKDDPRTEMWVNDFHNEEWIDAFKSYYVDGNITPMDYGLGAQKEQITNALNYEEAVKFIYQRSAEKSKKPCCEHDGPPKFGTGK
jgi:copper chaperone NosL